MEATDVINSRLTIGTDSDKGIDDAKSIKRDEPATSDNPFASDDENGSGSRSDVDLDNNIANEASNRQKARSRSRSRSRSPLRDQCNDRKLKTLEPSANTDDEHTDGEMHLSFFSSGPVFPARHSRDLLLNQTDEPKSYLNNCLKSEKEQESQLPSFLNDSKVNTQESPNVTLKQGTNGSSENLGQDENKTSPGTSQECNFLSGSQGLQGGIGESVALGSKGAESAGKEDMETESLAPLSASFFNCQYQTPSWVDDPLIGVPASAMENKNTHRKTGADMRILTAYMRSLNEMRLPEAIPPAELDKYLSSFFLVVRKADGSEYEPCSLRAMLASIERYLRFKNYPLSLTRDSAFANMRNVLKLKQQTLRSIGKGQKTSSEVSPSSLAREGKIAQLFKSQEMGPYTPSSVVFTLCFYFCMYLKLRKSTENKKLLWGDIALHKDESGREFLTFSSQMLRRNQGSTKMNARQKSYRVWADPSSPEKDPVTIYKFYAQKRPTSMNTSFAPFYLGVNVIYPTQGQPWYRPAAMGINKLNEMVRQIRDITGVRTSSDFQGSEAQGKEKPSKFLDVSPGNEQSNGHGPLRDAVERQTPESFVVKTEINDDCDDEDDGCSNLAIDFSQEANENMMDATPPPNVESAFSVQPILSEGDNSNDSYSMNSGQEPLAKMNHLLGFDTRSGNAEEGDQNTNASSPPDSPLNCSTKDRLPHSQVDIQHSTSLGLSEALSVDEAKQQVVNIVRKMDPTAISQFEQWLHFVKFKPDPFTGRLICNEESPSDNPPLSIKATSNCSPSGANIILNISLTQKALQGNIPISITAEASDPSVQQQSGKNAAADGYSNSLAPKASLFQGKQGFLQGSRAAVSSPLSSKSSSSSVSAPQQANTATDTPLDLAPSLGSRDASKSSSSLANYQQAKSNLWSAISSGTITSNGHPLLTSLFPNSANLSGGRSNSSAILSSSNTTTNGDSAAIDSSPLAKRLRLSAEQAEAYTSASILASLSSASLANERIRLQLLQAASLGAAATSGGSNSSTAGYGLDPHTAAGLLDLATSSEVMRSQLLQHYGMKIEPK